MHFAIYGAGEKSSVDFAKMLKLSVYEAFLVVSIVNFENCFPIYIQLSQFLSDILTSQQGFSHYPPAQMVVRI